MRLRQTVALIFHLYICLDETISLSAPQHQPTRRQWWTRSVAGAAALVVTTCCSVKESEAFDELPSFLRPYATLSPMGLPNSSNTITLSKKSTNLPLHEMADRLTKDLTVGATDLGPYFITGDLSQDLFRDDCVFVDPVNQVSSLIRYKKALHILFDPDQSKVQLLTTPLVVNEEQRTISGSLRSRGVLKFPWKPRITSYDTDIIYTIDNNGLISKQSQVWSKSASKGLRESLTPSIFPPPAESNLILPSDEPSVVTQLFEYVNGRRPDEYSAKERLDIARLIDTIADNRYSWQRDLLPGKWLLVYIQPGPDGVGIDRRIPFLDFPFNSNYQVFEPNGVSNIGELFGPLLRVTVAGTLKEDNTESLQVPKRFVADINSGKICWKENPCAPLPISGKGLFDGVYLGERLRIGKNVNGGGARVVQIRIA